MSSHSEPDLSPTTNGRLHTYRSVPPLVAFEHLPPHDQHVPPTNTLLFVGGLTDGLHTVPFVRPLAASLPPSWSLVEVLLSSSYTGWGSSSLTKDVREIAQCVTYFRKLRSSSSIDDTAGGKIILMGHSTGCQDVMHYLTSPPGVSAGNVASTGEGNGETKTRPAVDAGILQASVSDREVIVLQLTPQEYTDSCTRAQEMVDSKQGADVLPLHMTRKFLPTPISASRWLSMASPGPAHAGEDDYFSSDLGDERLRATFAKIGGTGAVLGIYYGGEDEAVPESVDKRALVERWIRIVEDGGGVVGEGSGVVPGATHNVEGGGKPLEDLIGRVGRMIKQVARHKP